MLVGGIDCDTTNISLVLINGKEPIWCQSLATKKEKDWQKKIFDMADSWDELLGGVFNGMKPDLILVEAPIMIQNPKTTIKLAEVDSLVCKVLFDRGIPYQPVQNLVWKKAILGKARVTKDEIRDYVLERYTVDFAAFLKSPQHCYDALCIAEYARILAKEAKEDGGS